MSSDFIRLRHVAFLWISFNENFNNIKIENSHNFIYIGNLLPLGNWKYFMYKQTKLMALSIDGAQAAS